MAISVRSKKTVEAIIELWLQHNAPTDLAATDERSLVDAFTESRQLGGVASVRSKKTVEVITKWCLLHVDPTHLATTNQRRLVDAFAESRQVG